MRGESAQKVLAMLKSGKPVSGQEMAKELRISRAAVNKAVRTLRARGYEIDSRTGKGYLLRLCRAPRADIISSVSGGYPLFLYDSVPSTNDVALNLLKEGCPTLTAVVANSQSAGRGRVGRKFFSPAGTGIYMSVAVRGIESYSDLLVLTPAAAVAVMRAIGEVLHIQTSIKWVNDLYYEGKKVCGILTQSAINPDGSICGAVVGIGINVTGEMPQELQEIARSLKETVTERERDRLIGAVIAALAQVLPQLHTRAFMSDYRAFSCVLGRQVSFESGGVEYTGVAESIDDDGALQVKIASGSIKLNSGEVSVRL